MIIYCETSAEAKRRQELMGTDPHPRVLCELEQAEARLLQQALDSCDLSPFYKQELKVLSDFEERLRRVLS